MQLEKHELDALQSNSLSIRDARDISELIDSDLSVNGIFPNNTAAAEDFTNPDIEKFKAKWCSWWPIAKILLQIAKIFTKERGDQVIDEMIKLGNTVCREDREQRRAERREDRENS